ncbi:SgcJ/EcaC family oxidoreductase [Rhodococcus sp. HNM0569]|uniref:SgcJ/EcaC family oxidoreductase n=1 Tax=Rhodococcus sp. HNM0569 TaxID=2716340 RepID=UPI00146C5A6D|nr:SgcJ/EcaC family oxidoreductase [Rhodococcus sp. HNM0569]NLU82293.1 SgcJ/EcaC family oxidoreductase [Rhodococcus sp. HNM0569]
MEATTSDRPVVRDITTDHAADVAAITQLVGDVETGYNTNDAELMVSGFTANASAGNAVGTLITGYDSLFEAAERGLGGFLKDEFVRYDLGDIEFLRPDVAVVHKFARATTADGELVDETPAMVALYVMVKENDHWWVAARQNTPVSAA